MPGCSAASMPARRLRASGVTGGSIRRSGGDTSIGARSPRAMPARSPVPTSTVPVFTGAGGLAGGLVGVNTGTIIGSSATGLVSAGPGGDYGGLVGNNTGTIARSFASGALTAGDGSLVGGLAGYNSGTIGNSYAIGAVGGGATGSAGGLVGENDKAGQIANAFATGAGERRRYARRHGRPQLRNRSPTAITTRPRRESSLGAAPEATARSARICRLWRARCRAGSRRRCGTMSTTRRRRIC